MLKCSLTLAIPGLIFGFGSVGWFLTYEKLFDFFVFEKCLKKIFRYGIAVSRPQHVVALPDWPTISNTGSFAPESCVFSQIFNMMAFLGYYMLAVYYKYCQAKGVLEGLNSACLYLGIVGLFGFMMVGNFQFVSIRM